MAKKSKSSDVNVTAHEILQALTGEPAGSTSVQREPASPVRNGKPDKKPPKPPLPVPLKNPAAVALGRLGGLKGGKARMAKLSARRRTEIAKKAANARWKA
jgi:hypothetical protein